MILESMARWTKYLKLPFGPVIIALNVAWILFVFLCLIIPELILRFLFLWPFYSFDSKRAFNLDRDGNPESIFDRLVFDVSRRKKS